MIDNVSCSMKSGAARILDESVDLPREKLIAVVVRAKTGDRRAQDEVIRAVCKFAFLRARSVYERWHRMLPPGALFCDVYNSALAGVHRAVEGFDEESGYSFTTYANAWIINHAQRAVYSMIGAASIPEHVLRDPSPEAMNVYAGQVLSLDYRVPDSMMGSASGRMYQDGMLPDVRESLSMEEPGNGEVEDTDSWNRLVDVMRRVDRRMPGVAAMIVDGVHPREIARVKRMKTRDVERLGRRAAAMAMEREILAGV